jgi:hypothetical protein
MFLEQFFRNQLGLLDIASALGMGSRFYQAYPGDRDHPLLWKENFRRAAISLRV